MELKVVIVFVCAAVVCESVTQEITPSCYPGQFFNRKLLECTPCSTCRDNQVVQRNCFDDQDTLCGPFPGYPQFIQHPAGTVDFISYNEESNDKLPTTPMEIVAAADDKWFTITMVLVGILVVTCVTGVIIVLVTCVVCRRKDREIVYEPEFNTPCSLIGEEGSLTKSSMIEQFKLISERES